MNTTTHSSLAARIRTSVRRSWDRQMAAQEVLLRRTPYDNFLQKRS